jgi:hypothetical protein
MRITADTRKAHGELSDYGLRFLEYIEKNPESLKRSNFQSLDWHDKKIKLQCWPTFVNQHKRKEMETASVLLCNLIKMIPQRIFSNHLQEISQYYGVPLDIVKMQLDATNQEHITQLLARGDFIFSPLGLKCIEFNISSDLGGLDKAMWESLYMEIPVISRFLKEYQVEIQDNNLLFSLLEYLITFVPGKWFSLNELNIAFAIPRFLDNLERDREKTFLNQTYKDVLRLIDGNLQGQIVFCDYHHLKTTGDGVYYQDKKIHILVEFYSGIVSPKILNHFAQGNILVYNGPITRLLSNKLNLALLSENRDSDIFSDMEREAIKKYIPWTRKIVPGDTFYEGKKIKLEDFIISNKEKLVIKPSEGYGGIGVCVGKYTPGNQWQEYVKKAMKQKNLLVQEYIESLPYLYQYGENGCVEHDLVWGGFVFGSKYVGGWVRMLPKKDTNGVINTQQGAEESAVFEVNQ